MKKIISSVLVFALMGVPVVSGAFANNEKHVESIASLSVEAKESEKTAMKVSEKFNRVQEILSKSKGKLTTEDRNECVTELLDLICDANQKHDEGRVKELSKILRDVLDEDTDKDQNSEDSSEKSKKKEIKQTKTESNKKLKERVAESLILIVSLGLIGVVEFALEMYIFKRQSLLYRIFSVL